MSRSIRTFRKDPDEVLDYSIDWETNGWLASGETISTSTWTAASGITVDSSSATDTVATVWLSGGTDGSSYEVTNRIVTNAGRTGERTLCIVVGER